MCVYVCVNVGFGSARKQWVGSAAVISPRRSRQQGPNIDPAAGAAHCSGWRVIMETICHHSRLRGGGGGMDVHNP